jgi:hypothetical protein
MCMTMCNAAMKPQVSKLPAQRSAAPPTSQADGAIRWLDQVTEGSDLQDLQFVERGDPAGWNTLTEVAHSHIVIT